MFNLEILFLWKDESSTKVSVKTYMWQFMNIRYSALMTSLHHGWGKISFLSIWNCYCTPFLGSKAKPGLVQAKNFPDPDPDRNFFFSLDHWTLFFPPSPPWLQVEGEYLENMWDSFISLPP